MNFFSVLFLFIIFFFLVVFFHLYIWGFGYSFFLSGCRPWISSFECGFLSRGLSESSFSVTYFILLVFFVIFDLEISLLLNIPFQGDMYYNYYSYSFFLIMLSFGYAFEVYSGYVSWSY